MMPRPELYLGLHQGLWPIAALNIQDIHGSLTSKIDTQLESNSQLSIVALLILLWHGLARSDLLLI